MESRMKLEKVVKIILLTSIAITAGFIVYQLIFNRPSPYINFGILNEDGQYGAYPYNVTEGEVFRLRYNIGNYYPDISEFSVRTYRANSSSTVSLARGVDNATFLGAYNHTVAYNATFTSDPMQFNITQAGNDYRICFELWVLNNTRWNYLKFSVQWIWINCTEP